MSHTKTYWVLLTVVSALLFLAIDAEATPIATLLNTGVKADGSLATGGAVDLHYTFSSPDSGFPGPNAFVASPIPAGFWVNSSFSQYIAPQANQNFPPDCCPVVTYTYRTTFDLTGLNPASAAIAGLWRTDDEGLNILINGTSTGLTSVVHTDTLFAISSGFIAGLNTLDFLVINSHGGPTGLRVEISSAQAAPAVPEPSTLLLLGVGLAGLAAVPPSSLRTARIFPAWASFGSSWRAASGRRRRPPWRLLRTVS